MSDDDVRSPRPVARGERYDPSDTFPYERGISLFDAVYGFALTLLISNVDPPPPEAWTSLAALAASDIPRQLVGFGLSFAVIAVVWRSNIQLMKRLSGVDGPVTVLNLITTAFVVLIAFTTQGISDAQTSELALPTIFYALNIAIVVIGQVAMYQLARARGLEAPARSDARNRAEVLDALVTPAVFLLSVPVALLISADAAKLTWLSLLVLAPLSGVLLRRRFPE